MDVNAIIKKYGLSESYDKKRKAKVIDVKKLNKFLISKIKNFKNDKKNFSWGKIFNGVIIDSHLSHYLPKKYVDLCIVVKCSLKTLKKRLSKKKYPESKIRENLDAEIFDVCLTEAQENNHNILIVETTKGININKLSKKIGGLVGI